MRYFITGITGTFGRACVEALLADAQTERIVGLTRSEHHAAEFLRDFPDARLDCWLGDVRDAERLTWAFRVQPDVVIHAAAQKRIDWCEREPEEAYKTNVVGSLNVVKAAILAQIPKVLILSTDKATSPETVYGSTKLQAESLALGFVHAKHGASPTKVAILRWGNILGSAGSVLERFFQARVTGAPIQITDPEATRFWWSVDEAVAFALRMLTIMQGGEIFVPKLASSRVVDLARAIAPASRLEVIGMRGPEKLHESMINTTEARYTWDCGEYYLLKPRGEMPDYGLPVGEGFRYGSETDPQPVSFLCA